MKFIAILIIVSSIQQCSAQQKKSIQGEWINKEDSHSIVKFDKNTFYQIYNTDTVHSAKYFRSSVSCDSNYLKNNDHKNLDFIRIEDGTCFEITGLTDSTLAYRHTVSGRMQVFYKSH
jgi:hypothetical protein